MKKKVLAYIFKSHNKDQILVFDHCAFPEVSPQVIGGSIEDNEDLSQAIVREVYEESGLLLSNPQYIGKFSYLRKDIGEKQERYLYEFVDESLPDNWTHTVSSGEEDKGLKFQFYWLPVYQAEKVLVADMGLYLNSIK